jgi:hypothetical protein
MRLARIPRSWAPMKRGSDDESERIREEGEAASTRLVVEPVSPKLNSEHRETLERIFAHPTSANIEWRQVRSLLEAVGTVQEHHNGKLEVSVGSTTKVLQPPRTKDVDQDQIADLRHLLRSFTT